MRGIGIVGGFVVDMAFDGAYERAFGQVLVDGGGRTYASPPRI